MASEWKTIGVQSPKTLNVDLSTSFATHADESDTVGAMLLDRFTTLMPLDSLVRVNVLMIGIGSISGRDSMRQLVAFESFLRALSSNIHIGQRLVVDPVLTETELAFLETHQWRPLENRVGAYPLNELGSSDDDHHIIFMPHCGKVGASLWVEQQV